MASITSLGLEKWKRAIVGYILGFSPFVQSQWKEFGNVGIHPLPSGIFVFNSLLEKGPWSFSKRPLILSPWAPGSSLARKPVDKIPVWIKLPSLSLDLWTPQSLSLILSHVGKPLFADKPSRLAYARVCVEITAGTVLPDSLHLEYHNGLTIEQELDYEWLPQSCTNCKRFGHSTDNCSANTIYQANTALKQSKENSRPASSALTVEEKQQDIALTSLVQAGKETLHDDGSEPLLVNQDITGVVQQQPQLVWHTVEAKKTTTPSTKAFSTTSDIVCESNRFTSLSTEFDQAALEDGQPPSVLAGTGMQTGFQVGSNDQVLLVADKNGILSKDTNEVSAPIAAASILQTDKDIAVNDMEFVSNSIEFPAVAVVEKGDQNSPGSQPEVPGHAANLQECNVGDQHYWATLADEEEKDLNGYKADPGRENFERSLIPAHEFQMGALVRLSNFDTRVSPKDVKNIFCKMGHVNTFEPHLDKNGRFTGTAELIYSHPIDAHEAVKRYNNVKFGEKVLKIEIVACKKAYTPIASRTRHGRGRGRGRERAHDGRPLN